MSLYNLMNGVNPATFFILPMLGEKHPEEYPRFRDCFADPENYQIIVLTRTGGGNRNSGFGEEELQKHPNYIKDEDHKQDNTYAVFLFSVPEEWINDFEKVISGRIKEISEAYKDRLYLVYPKLKGYFDKLFAVNDVSEEKESSTETE